MGRVHHGADQEPAGRCVLRRGLGGRRGRAPREGSHARRRGCAGRRARPPTPSPLSYCLPPDLKYPRYKFVVQVVLGQNKRQGVRVASRCLWDVDNDSHASFSFKNVRDCAGPSLPLFLSALPLAPLFTPPLTQRLTQLRPQDTLYCNAMCFGLYVE